MCDGTVRVCKASRAAKKIEGLQDVTVFCSHCTPAERCKMEKVVRSLAGSVAIGSGEAANKAYDKRRQSWIKWHAEDPE
jgi:hypothetical protein